MPQATSAAALIQDVVLKVECRFDPFRLFGDRLDGADPPRV